MTNKEFEADIRSRVNLIYKDQRGTESYERAFLLAEIDRLRVIEAAAINLCKVKDRHNSEIAMHRLMIACKE